MNSILTRCLACLTLVLACARADAAFHLMQIEQVIGGVNGDVTAQAIQLRMRSAGQNLVNGTRLRAWDANGMNPIIVHTFVGNVANNAAGSRILVCTTAFLAQTTPAPVANGIMSTPIPASYLAAGKLTFEDSSGLTTYWSVAWGGYTGPNTGAATNDPDGQFSPAFALPLPSTSASALRFNGAFGALSANNAADYSITAGAAVFTNNAGASFTVIAPPATGRCCIAADNCQVLTSANCATAGGTWTEGAACEVGACGGGFVGACCDGSSCSITTQFSCGLLGGTYSGDNTACTVGPPNNFVECCPANWNGINGLDVPDIFGFLTDWFANVPAAQNYGGAPGVPAIFAFLTDWFGGCS